METTLSLNIAKKFYCKKCNYECSKKSDFKKHLITRKHLLETNGNNWKQLEIIGSNLETIGNNWKQ